MIKQKLFKVCVSCPSDMVRERQICEEAIKTFSDLYTNDEIAYSVTHFATVPSDFSAPAQDVINKNWEGFDLYIGIMGARYGSPTESYGSGTEEEFSIAYQKSLEDSSVAVGFLFKDISKPINEFSKEELEQYQSVQGFKSRASKLGLYQTFSNDNDFLNSVNLILKKHAGEQEKSISSEKYQYELIAELPNEDVFQINKKFFQTELDSIGAEITNNKKSSLSLGELYIPLDLAVRTLSNNEYDAEQIISSEKIYDGRGNYPYSILCGDEKAGKTSFCHMTYRKLHKKGFVPVKISGSDFKNRNFEDIRKNILKSFGQQYSEGALERYKNLDFSKKVLIVDDLDRTSLNYKIQLEILEWLENHYSKVIITASSNWILNLNLLAPEEINHISAYSIFSFEDMGYRIRDELIQKWVSVGCKDTISDESLYDQTTRNRSVIDGILNTNCVPKKPFVVLVLLQAIQGGSTNKLTNGSFVRYYQYLIDTTILKGAPESKIELYYSFLPEIAYAIYTKEDKALSEKEFGELVKTYAEKYALHEKELVDVKSSLLFLELLVTKDAQYEFKHSYTYYFFLGQYFADNLDRVETKNHIEDICNNLNIKENANVIIFTSYHTNDFFIINKVCALTDSLFSEIPIFDTVSNASSALNKLVTEGPKVIIDSRAAENRKQALVEQDNSEKIVSKKLTEDIDKKELDEMVFSAHANMAHRSAEILGQLLKNHSVKFEANIKQELYLKTINVGLRCLNVLMEAISENADALEGIFEQRISQDKKINKDNEEKLAKRALFEYAYFITTGFIKTLSQFTGSEMLAKTYEDVLEQHDLEIYHLIDLSTRMDVFNSFPIKELEKIAKRTSKNNLSTAIIRSLVKHRLYMRPLDNFRQKQQICQAVGITMQEQINIGEKSKAGN